VLHRKLLTAALLGAVAWFQATSGAAQTNPAAPKKAPAKAAPKSPDGGKKENQVDLERLKTDLESGDEAKIVGALETVERAGDPRAAPLLEALLKRGASVAVLSAAISTTGSLKQASSSAAIAPYLQHRAQDVRRAAAKALVKTKGPNAIKALRQGLRSSDPVVRGVSATGLGELGAKEALGDLFGALDRYVGEAAAAIGQLCSAADCDKLLARLGKVPLQIMTSGLDQMLFRREIADEQKIQVIARVRELGTRDSAVYLAEILARWPKDGSPRVKQALDAAVKATGGAGKKSGG
jgi:hypothetical protein